jgi:nitroreductase
MDLERAIKERRSIRKFKPDPVPRSLLEKILDLAIWAPSGMNQQNWHFVVLKGEKLERLREMSRRAFDEHLARDLMQMFSDRPHVCEVTKEFFYTLGNASVVLLAYRGSTVEGEATDIQSVAAAIQNLLLAAHANGLGGCWMTGPTSLETEINTLVAVDDLRLQAVIPIGYPESRPPIPKRRGAKIKWIGFD